MPDPLAETLRAIVGDGHVLLEADMKATYERDWTGRYHGDARLIVRPANTDEVTRVLVACGAAGAAVIPQGGNTGLVGGSVPRGGEIVLSLLRLTGFSEIDRASGELTVGAGVTLAALQDHVREAGFAFGVDLASRQSATIGGMVATNAGGIRVLRYGGMRAQVVGIEAVRPDGAVLRRLPGLHKDNTGYDLPGLLAGSEGTLAVITAVRLRLVPMLEARAVALLAVGSIGEALDILPAVKGVASLEAVELFFRDGVELVRRHAGLPLPFDQDYPVYLLIECAAREDPLPELAAALEHVNAKASAVASDRPGRDRLWAYRERHTECINVEGVPHKLDVALPLPRLEEFERDVRIRLARDVPEARPILFGHIADGNLHVNILGLAADDDRATDCVLRHVAELGGSISAEHGVGVAKTHWLELTRSHADIETMLAIRRAFDPTGMLNPGVIHPAELTRPI